MSSRSLPPRAVVVTRPSELELLLERHGTRAQARFFLESRGQRLEALDEIDALHRAARHEVLAAIPVEWRRASVSRAELDRFLFEPNDVVIAVGQDGLVANVARYVGEQPVIGVNPSRRLYDGVLVRFAPAHVGALLRDAGLRGRCLSRTLVEASTDDGQVLRALNEIYIGHRAHQSARYTLCYKDTRERQSSSGLLVSTGTGATGWAASVALRREGCPPLPEPGSSDLCLLVREPWPGAGLGTGLAHARFGRECSVQVISEMNEGGVVFGDGMEADHLPLGWGQRVTVRAAATSLQLVV